MRQIEDRVPDGTDDCCRQAYSEGVGSVLLHSLYEAS